MFSMAATYDYRVFDWGLRRVSTVLVSLCFLGTYGCATPQTGPSKVPLRVTSSSAVIAPLTLEQLVVSQNTAETLEVLHRRGLERLEQRDFISAESDFALCAVAQPDSPLVPSCLFHGGIASDELRKYERALERFNDVSTRFPAHELAVSAGLRALRLATHLEHWDFAAAQAEWLMARRTTLRPFDLVLPHGALAMAAVQRGDDVAAEQHVARARSLIDRYELDVPGKIHRDLAVAYFALGEVRRIRAERLTFVPIPINFSEVLEGRCQLLLDAQAAYSDAMRAYDGHWSTMAGYRVSELYASLHAEVMRMVASHPEPDPERRKLLEGAMRLRYAVLTKKAQNMILHTLTMAERLGEKSEWVERAKAIQADLAREAQAEEDAISRLPYSRETLTYALQGLSSKGASGEGGRALPKAPPPSEKPRRP
jgi:tetratricopeptide (TPR) repeat protein